ncbi:MAG: DUF302 domain-containing protein [Ignavibacteria bacterium]|nr:DUF302 domain-containing protein [Ignavibacteria bacterium]
MNYTVQLNKTFEQALKEIELNAEKYSFKVQHVHPVSEILKGKGFEIEKYSIIELCNPKFAHIVLSKDKKFGSILPCKILLYEEEGKLFVSAPKPTDLVEKLGMNEIKDLAQQVEDIIKNIIIEVGS